MLALHRSRGYNWTNLFNNAQIPKDRRAFWFSAIRKFWRSKGEWALDLPQAQETPNEAPDIFTKSPLDSDHPALMDFLSYKVEAREEEQEREAPTASSLAGVRGVDYEIVNNIPYKLDEDKKVEYNEYGECVVSLPAFACQLSIVLNN